MDTPVLGFGSLDAARRSIFWIALAAILAQFLFLPKTFHIQSPWMEQNRDLGRVWVTSDPAQSLNRETEANARGGMDFGVRSYTSVDWSSLIFGLALTAGVAYAAHRFAPAAFQPRT